jgi:hypothetical protein
MDFLKKKVVIADVDDTICESCQRISSSMAEQIASMIKKGYTWAFISGTAPHHLKEMISSSLKEKHFLLATTGTACLEILPNNVKEAYSYSLTHREKAEIMEAFEKLINKYDIKTMTTKEDQVQDRETQITLSAIGRHAPSELKRKYDSDASKRKEWIKFLKKILDENKYEITHGGTTSIDITRKGLDKAWGIKKFAKHYNIDLNSIIFIGDQTQPGGNDYPATKVVDYITVKDPKDTLIKLKEFNRK